MSDIEITDEQIEALRDEAASAGDDVQVALCTVALHDDWRTTPDLSDAMWSELESLGVHVALLGSDTTARGLCERAIADAAAQVES